jgi:RNA polymerase sigma-70 factor, ECF subfamily
MNETLMPKDAEQELIVKCQQGDRQAFNRLVMQYQHLVYNFLYRLDSRMQNVEDLAQEVFIKVFRSIRKLKDVHQFKSWLHRIAVRVYIDDLRQRKRLQERVIADDKVLDIQPDPQATPAQMLEGQELQRTLQEAIERLPEEFKLAIVLREIQELSYDEIANTLRCSIGTVRSRIFRGRQLLRNMLEDHVTV